MARFWGKKWENQLFHLELLFLWEDPLAACVVDLLCVCFNPVAEVEGVSDRRFLIHNNGRVFEDSTYRERADG